MSRADPNSDSVRSASEFEEPAAACRPFDRRRSGMVLGEGAGCLLLEDLEFARNRGANVLGEVTGYSSSTVASPRGMADYRQAIINVLEGVLNNAGLQPADIGHIHAHGLSTVSCDRDEAQAIAHVFGDVRPPVVAAKSYMGNLGAGSGIVETVASLQALQHDRLFAIRNYQEPDPECDIQAARPGEHVPGDCFINLNVTAQGQASAIVVSRPGDIAN